MPVLFLLECILNLHDILDVNAYGYDGLRIDKYNKVLIWFIYLEIDY
jgi:hypothetical protein